MPLTITAKIDDHPPVRCRVMHWARRPNVGDRAYLRPNGLFADLEVRVDDIELTPTETVYVVSTTRRLFDRLRE